MSNNRTLTYTIDENWLEFKTDEVLDKLDIYKIYLLMTAVGWTWGGAVSSPSESEIEEKIKEDMRCLYEHTLNEDTVDLKYRYVISSGGFTSEIYNTPIGLRFSISFNFNESVNI